MKIGVSASGRGSGVRSSRREGVLVLLKRIVAAYFSSAALLSLAAISSLVSTRILCFSDIDSASRREAVRHRPRCNT
jgi:hypothetical protein